MRNLILTGLIVGLAGYGIGRYLTPEKTVTVEKEVIERVIIRPDGTRETERITKDKKESETKPKDIEKTQYKVSALVGLDLSAKKEVYGIDVQKRLFGNVSAGVWGLTNSTIGISIGYEF